MNLYQIYFSPTGSTKKVADIMSKTWNCPKIEIDLSNPDIDFSQFTFSTDDLCIVSVPCFGGRVPGVSLSRINQMTGGNAQTIIVVTYGNRAYEDTLIELKNTLKARSFHCIAAIAAVTEHSIMHQFGEGRPNADDESELIRFTDRIRKKLEQNCNLKEIQVPGNTSYRVYTGLPLKPKANKKCSKCGLCATNCPTQAISKANPSSINKSKCISCMRCTSLCPQHARNLNKLALLIASKKMQKVCATPKSNELFL